MAKQLCLIHANCQGDALAPLLEANSNFSKHFEIRHYLNYKCPELEDSVLSQCGLFLHQYLAPKWGAYSTEHLLGQLSASTKNLIIPNFFFKGYWPFWTNKTEEIEFADELLEDLLAKGLTIEQSQNFYLKLSDSILDSVETTAMHSIEQEREKEKHSCVKYADLLEENWRNKQLFLTVNHPDIFLLSHAANTILNLLGLGEVPQKAIKNYKHPQGDFWLPIHPAVAKKLNLPFVSYDRKYPCFGAELNHSEYTARYLACRKYNRPDFVAVLKALAEDGKKKPPV